MYRIDVTSYLFTILLSILLLVYIIPNQCPPYPGFGVPSTLFPNILSVVMLACSCFALFKTVSNKKKDQEESSFELSDLIGLSKFILVIILSMPLMNFTGFIPGGIITMLAFEYLLGDRNIIRMLIVAVSTVILQYILFWYGLKILLP